jgi:hypothetical protein
VIGPTERSISTSADVATPTGSVKRSVNISVLVVKPSEGASANSRIARATVPKPRIAPRIGVLLAKSISRPIAIKMSGQKRHRIRQSTSEIIPRFTSNQVTPTPINKIGQKIERYRIVPFFSISSPSYMIAIHGMSFMTGVDSYPFEIKKIQIGFIRIKHLRNTERYDYLINLRTMIEIQHPFRTNDF